MVKPKEKQVILDQDDDMATDDVVSGSEPELDIICNMISVLSIKYYMASEVTEEEDNVLVEGLTKHKLLCYYVTKDDFFDEYSAIFERTHMPMQRHLKPLLIRGKVENVGINKVLVSERSKARSGETNMVIFSLVKKPNFVIVTYKISYNTRNT